MAYDAAKELERVKKYYEGDPLQKRFSLLLCGGIGTGKTYLLRTARFPVHIDSFDPGGTKCLKPWIDKGHIVVDTSFENEDPFKPTAWDRWKKVQEVRFKIGYFDLFGTYAIDSSTKWQDAAMNAQLKIANRLGQAPQRNHDYVPVKIDMVNYITKFMNIPCDFILNGHFKENEEILSIDTKTGITRKTVEYTYLTIGQAATTIPLLFDEIYVLQTKESSDGLVHELLIESQGKFTARSRLKSNGKLNAVEPANIKELLKKIGLTWEDKPKLEFTVTEEQKSV
jgi:hypothetical protein